MIDTLREQYGRLRELDEQIGQIERRLRQWQREDSATQRIAAIPGVGLHARRVWQPRRDVHRDYGYDRRYYSDRRYRDGGYAPPIVYAPPPPEPGVHLVIPLH